VLLYSDGITEAMNARSEEYGEQRLVNLMSTAEGVNAFETQEAILADVNSFLAGTSPQDDITLVVLRAA
jgi:phosphoserine phosphatase RsbU/P